MKIIGSVKEDLAVEKRIAITPESTKKFTDLNISVFLEKNYGEHLGISDEDYINKGAKLCSSVVERYVDIVEIASSILATPTKNINFQKFLS